MMSFNSKGKGSKPSSLQAFLVRNVVWFMWAILALSVMGYITVDINSVVIVYVQAAFSWAEKE
jgi:hypothetical protein